MEIKDGDFFNYSWKNENRPSHDPYWCRDGRCVARERNGKIILIDTFNYWPFKVGGKLEESIFTLEGLDQEYSKYIDTERFNLNFICNLNNYEFVKEWEKDDYENVVFVGYQCTRLWAKPRGSVKSKAAILAKLMDQLHLARQEERSVKYRIQRIEEEIMGLDDV